MSSGGEWERRRQVGGFIGQANTGPARCQDFETFSGAFPGVQRPFARISAIALAALLFSACRSDHHVPATQSRSPQVSPKVMAATSGSSPRTNAPSKPAHTRSNSAPKSGRNRQAQPDTDTIVAAHAHFSAGVLHEMNHESDAALNEYYQAALLDPAEDDLCLKVASKFVENKQLDKAVEVLNRRAEMPDASGIVFVNLGILYSQLGKTNEAVAASRTAIKRSPDELPGYQNLFLIALQNKHYAEALKTLDEAAARAKTDTGFLLPLAGLYLRLSVAYPEQKKSIELKAKSVLQRVEKLNPENPAEKLQLAESLNAVGDYAPAAKIYLELLKTLPDNPLIREKVHARLTDIYLRGNDRKQAAEQLHAMLRDDPTNPQAYFWLGSIALEDKQFQEAVDDFNRCLLLNKNFEPAYYELAVAQLNLNKPGDALATLEQARQKFPAGFALEFWTGSALSRQKAYKEAVQHYTKAEVLARATNPKQLSKLFYFEFGAAFERAGDVDQAEKYFQKCLEAAPDFAEAMNYLGYMWVEHGKKLEEAKTLIEKAVKLEPKNPAYLDSLGWVQFKLGQPRDGLTNIMKAAEFSPQPDATIYDHLGDIYAALNQSDKAREAWQKSLSLEANDNVRKKLTPPP